MSKRILFIVEGKKTERTFLKRLLSGLGITDERNIFVFGTNIFVLYEKVFGKGDSEDIDLLGALREGAGAKDREILSKDYSDIYLVFDAEFQDQRFDSEHLGMMLKYFDNSTENGKLYLNYPMMESYLHLKSLDDSEYMTRTVALADIKQYKKTARDECCSALSNASSYSRGLILVILSHNIRKTRLILMMGSGSGQDLEAVPDLGNQILVVQRKMQENENKIYVLNTSVFIALEQDSRVLSEIFGEVKSSDDDGKRK